MQRELRTIDELGAFRTENRNLVVANAAPEPIRVAELTAAAFGAARVPPLLGRESGEHADDGSIPELAEGSQMYVRLLTG